MKIKHSILILLSVFLQITSISLLYAQKEAYNWYFGENAGITFNTSDVNPIALMASSISSAEGCASISDANGRLLFYTNGETVWNRNHSPMRNGNGLSGNNNATQSSLIIPKPNSNNIFYLITNDYNRGVNGCRYSEIDMNSDGGLGDVLSPKNKLLFSNPTEKLTAVRHANGTDWWIIMHEWDSDVFRAYQVTSTGISLFPVTSISGSAHTGNLTNKKGQMKASQNGTKIALVIPNLACVELFDFDNSKGIIQNCISLKSSVFNDTYGVEFSPSGSYLYITKREIPSALFQFSLKSWSVSGILNTQTLIAESQDYGDFQSLQLAPDNKIYIARPTKVYLSKINNPEIQGKSCNFIDSAIYLAGRTSRQGLPNFYSRDLIKLTLGGNNVICEGDTLFLTSTFIFGGSYQWSGPSKFVSSLQNPFIVIQSSDQAGYYKLSVKVSGREYLDSILVTVNPTTKFNINTSGSVNICPGDSVTLTSSVIDNQLKYLWSNGQTTPSITVKNPGKYKLIIENKNGCKSQHDTVVNFIKFSTKIYPQSSTEFCLGDSVLLIASPIDAGNFVKWSTGESSDRVTIKSSQKVIMTVQNPAGCKGFDTIDVKVNDKLDVNISSDVSMPFCEGDTIQLSTNYSGLKFSYKWSTGDITSSIKVSKTGLYSVIVSYKSGCTDTATFDVVFNPKPKTTISANGPLTFCSGDSVKLSANTANPAGLIYKWSTGDSTADVVVSTLGNYTLTVTNASGCQDTISIFVNVLPRPKADILPDGSTNLCEGDALKLIASPLGSEYTIKWSTGAMTDYIWVNTTGKYKIEITNKNGCIDSAELTVRFNPKPIPVIIASGPLTICKGSAIKLYTADKYQTYKWSSGEDTESILVSSAGTYYVDVTDSNGCRNTSQTVKVTVSDVNVEINDISKTKFGNVCIGDSKTQVISIANNGIDPISIKSLSFVDDKTFSAYTGFNFPHDLSPNTSINADLKFNPKNLTQYNDTLRIVIDSPCFLDYRINVTGTGIAGSRVTIPDTTLPVGDEYCIPVKIKLTCGDTLRNKIRFRTTIVMDASIFIPYGNLHPFVKSTYMLGSFRYFDIEGELDSLTQKDIILFKICGTVLFGDYEWVNITINDLIIDNQYLSNIATGGELATYGVCALEISHIQKAGFTIVKYITTSDPSAMDIEIETKENGMFSVRLFDINGKTISTDEWYNGSQTKTIFTRNLPLNYPNGVYMIQVTSPGGSHTKPIIINK